MLTTLGALVVLVLSLHTGSLFTIRSRREPVQHTLGVLALYAVLFPYVFRTSEHWYGVPMQLMVAVMVTALDWFSFHEDMTRFSEADMCIFGNCRENARITGHLAHWADVAGLAVILWPLFDSKDVRAAALGVLAAYGAMGSAAIERSTRPGGDSDLTGKTDPEKCRHARIMSSVWRGGLNDLITALGVMAAWQALFTCEKDRCTAKHFPLSLLTGHVRDLFSKSPFIAVAVGRLVLSLLMVVGPQYANFVNTSYQHGRLRAEEYGLPSCFDDPDQQTQEFNAEEITPASPRA